MASGNVNFINPNGEHAQRAFEAYGDPNGVVHGQYVQNTTGLDGAKRVNAGDIDCITLIGINTALVSGTIRRHIFPELIGAGIGFFVVDNGAGSSGTPDQVGSLFVFNPGEED